MASFPTLKTEVVAQYPSDRTRRFSTQVSATTTGGSATRSIVLTGEWSRVFLDVELGLDTDSVVFGAVLDVGAIVDLFGVQVEAQPGVSDYKKTGESGGLYAQARFAEDELNVTAKGTDVFDAVIRIVAS